MVKTVTAGDSNILETPDHHKTFIRKEISELLLFTALVKKAWRLLKPPRLIVTCDQFFS